jgi:hypothetical protein
MAVDKALVKNRRQESSLEPRDTDKSIRTHVGAVAAPEATPTSSKYGDLLTGYDSVSKYAPHSDARGSTGTIAVEEPAPTPTPAPGPALKWEPKPRTPKKNPYVASVLAADPVVVPPSLPQPEPEPKPKSKSKSKSKKSRVQAVVEDEEEITSI